MIDELKKIIAQLEEMVAVLEDNRYTPSEPTGWDDIRNFTRDEFACRCGCGADDISLVTVKVAQRVRDHFNAPVIVSSGVRCPTHNARVGGVQNSRHLAGHATAMDFCVKGHSANEVLSYVNEQPEVVYAYAIDGNYVHMDMG
jgi:uncharacterized protein YcbK (DUF882 family)